ncbi:MULTISPECIES: 16S rRNA (guanine(966)-N(2))-methyltransferase [Serratia]|uniref:Ribosomal RNA small subunit methyltransferase D n=1 Tax=Serratia inhibens TaxID=2338073 RepID=A0AA92X2N5_9GAMM|nr:16S rRNA (guanine(966)-N(2))-methyltransferase [Serratia inhibens]ANS40708.1 Ribosomal RNA small subunit methyltransferase D [Serratia inhibens PRI-2C]MEE4408980.1 16S rRNA (guanine(966)-N(2))-methyltransferase [Serratia sp. C2(2)]MEE4449435.1 16S rRNA (guanine(966)-N(2))-methyltransferase [Serratia sp. C2(1)]RJF54936.1 16S rRNA (guanine(966)-N(2))-methyltransferase [Serratia inhibens]
MTRLSPRATAKKPPQAAAGQIRIIGGQWRGRKLPVPNSPGLRPTTDRVRETLFNWLAPVIQGARCLDCFAGSGALGLEALSRYAGSATLLEFERPVAQQLEKNLALLQGKGTVVNTNTLNWLAGNGQPFDVVFLDPPFRKGLLAETVTLLEQQGWLADEAWIYVEAEAESAAADVPANWQLHREKVAGQVAYRLYIRSQEKTDNAD